MRGDEVRRVLLPEFATVHGGIHVADQIENRGQRDRSVQIVREAGIEISLSFFGALLHSRIRAGAELLLLEARHKIPQPLDGAGRLLNAVRGEIQLPAIRHGKQQISGR